MTTNIAKVKAPVLQISGWNDDSRGPIDYTSALNAVPGHPFVLLVMGPGAHKGVDYVAGECSKGIGAVAFSAAALQKPVSVTFGVLTCDTVEQAIDRAGVKAGNKGAEAAMACLEMVNLYAKMAEGKRG